MAKGNFLSKEIQEKTLNITPSEFVDFLNKRGPDEKCAFCREGDYGVSPSPSGDSAAIVAAPVPNHSGVGVWLFPASCSVCGYTIFFNANFVARQILESK